MAGHVINPSTKFDDSTVIRSWVMSNDISHRIPLTGEGRSLGGKISGGRGLRLPIYWYQSKGNWMHYNFAADSFYIMKLCSRLSLFVLHCRSRPKYDTSMHFDSHFWGSWGRRRTLVDGSFESPCRVLVKRNWTSFSISYGWGAIRQNLSKLAAFRSG